MPKSENLVMLTNKKTNKLSLSLVWILTSVILFFTGLIISAANDMVGGSKLGTIMWVTGILSSFVFMFYSVFLWFKFKKTDAVNNLITAYVVLALLFVFGGLIASFLTFPDGFTFFIVGLGMLIFLFVVKLVMTIFSKEEDFIK